MLKITKLSQNLLKVLTTYPLMIACATALSLCVYLYYENLYSFERPALVCATGIGLFFALKQLANTYGKPWLWRILGLAVLGLYYALLPGYDFTLVLFHLGLPLLILVHLLVSFAPFTQSQKNTPSFWQYNIQLFLNFALAGAFTLVLVGGLLSAYFVFTELFDLSQNSSIFYGVVALGEGLFLCLIFLLLNEKNQQNTAQKASFPIALKFFAQYILLPIMGVYLLILYLYGAKILLEWELPKGWLSYGIISYALVGTLCVLLLAPLKDEKAWVRWFIRIFYYSLAPLMVLLFVAIFTRLLAYGVTEPRYFVVLIALWLTFCVGYFMVKGELPISLIPKSMAVAIIFGLFCPYLNAFSVSKISQQRELEQLLTQNHLLKDGKINPDAQPSQEVIRNIWDKFDFMHERNAQNWVAHYLSPEDVQALAQMNQGYFDSGKLSFFENWDKPQRQQITLQSENLPINFQGKGWLIPIEDIAQEATYSIDGQNLTLYYNLYEFKANLNGEPMDFTPLIKSFAEEKIKNIAPDFETISLPELKVTQQTPEYVFSLYLIDIEYNLHKKEVKYHHYKDLIIQRKE